MASSLLSLFLILSLIFPTTLESFAKTECSLFRCDSISLIVIGAVSGPVGQWGHNFRFAIYKQFLSAMGTVGPVGTVGTVETVGTVGPVGPVALVLLILQFWLTLLAVLVN